MSWFRTSMRKTSTNDKASLKCRKLCVLLGEHVANLIFGGFSKESEGAAA